MMAATSHVLTATVLLLSAAACRAGYLVGAGIYDVTGPAAEVNLMGYAKSSQVSSGIHIRQYSRAFIIADDKAPSSRVVFVSIDAGMVSINVKEAVIAILSKLYGNLYSDANVCISGTHSHSAVAGFHQYVLFEVTSLGFIRESYEAFVSGIVQSIVQAHASVKPGSLYLGSGDLLDTNINRSPSAYLNNPADERAQYAYDVDKTMTVLKMLDASNNPIGMISWFAVHGTSMNNTNGLLSGDNKGYASQLFERAINGASALPGHGPFVAAFAQSNEGDVSPNTKGPHCLDTGLPCDFAHSTCNGKTELCVASGPGRDMFESTQIIGRQQFEKASVLFQSASSSLSGPVDFRHQYVNMSDVTVLVNGTTKVKTCLPAMGYSFAAGTTDGPGEFNFTQGTTTSNPFWNMLTNLISKPTPEEVACQAPKPILLNTGGMDVPYAWQPTIVPVQLLRIGQLVVVAVPGEFSTMSGRRLRAAVSAALKNGGFPSDAVVIIAGLSNEYSDYITTFEEYQVQRYEGGSTIFGPHTLSAYIQKFTDLATALAQGKPVDAGPNPPDLMSKQITLLPPVIFDGTPAFKSFGDVVTDVKPSYSVGSQVNVTFVGASPRNNLQTNKTFLTVDKKMTDGSWQTRYTDANWETKFSWKRTSTLFGTSQVYITWDIPANQEVGVYRISYFGHSKDLIGNIKPFIGTSSQFIVGSGSSSSTVDAPPQPPSNAITRMLAKLHEIISAMFAM